LQHGGKKLEREDTSVTALGQRAGFPNAIHVLQLPLFKCLPEFAVSKFAQTGFGTMGITVT
jgi:hypothetical protein